MSHDNQPAPIPADLLLPRPARPDLCALVLGDVIVVENDDPNGHWRGVVAHVGDRGLTLADAEFFYPEEKHWEPFPTQFIAWHRIDGYGVVLRAGEAHLCPDCAAEHEE